MDEFEKDSILIDKLNLMALAYTNDSDLIKQAGLIDDLKGVANTVMQAVKTRFETEGIGAIATYLAPGMLWAYFGPAGLLIAWAFQAMGITPGSLIKPIQDKIVATVQSTGMFTTQDADRISKEVAPAVSATASLAVLHQLHKKGELNQLFKTAAGEPSKGILGWIASFASKISGLGTGVARSVSSGFIGWFIKAILMGVALVEGPTLAMKLLGGQATTPTQPGQPTQTPGQPQAGQPAASQSWWEEYQEKLFGPKPGTYEVTPQQPTQSYDLPQPISHNLQPSGVGETYFINDATHIWMAPLVNDSIRDTLLRWAVAIYPELSSKTRELASTPSFNKMVSELSKTYDSSDSGQLRILPHREIHTWKDIVDRFVGEIASKLKD